MTILCFHFTFYEKHDLKKNNYFFFIFFRLILCKIKFKETLSTSLFLKIIDKFATFFVVLIESS